MTDTKEFMREFLETIKKRGKPFKEKEIKLRNLNKMKYCKNCEGIVKIEMNGLNGYCNTCGLKLFTFSRENIF